MAFAAQQITSLAAAMTLCLHIERHAVV